MKQTFNVGYLQTPSVKNLENTKQALFESGLVESTTPDEMLPDAIEEGVKKLKGQSSAPVDNGPIYEGKYRVRYFDVDGTVLKIEYVADGGKTTPPDAPAYDPDYLIFDEWNYDTANYVVEQPTDIGATYKTVDDITYMWCRFTTNTGLSPTLAISGFTSIDWGDGTINTSTSHTYVQEGNYIIKIYGGMELQTSSNKQYVLGNTLYNTALQKCYLKKGISNLSMYAFYNCNSLELISIPKGVTIIYNGAFSYCYSLNHLTLPKGVTSLYYESVNYCNSLKSITIPQGPTSIPRNTLYNCYSLKQIIIPKGVTKISQSAFQYGGLKNIIIPKEFATLEMTAFGELRSLENMFIFAEQVPTLTSTVLIANRECIFWVNDNVIEQLKVATNWSNFASYMKPLSWYPSLIDPNA